jgi:hypothetical protein
MILQRFATAGVIAAALTLVACSDPKPPEKPATPPDAPTPATPPAQPADQIELSGLTLADRQANPLGGEIGCFFNVDGPDPFLIAYGSPGLPDPARGLVKVGGKIELISDPSGFDTMVDGAIFKGASKANVAVQVTGPATGGGESPPSPATLTYTRSGGGLSRVYVGTWTCGP